MQAVLMNMTKIYADHAATTSLSPIAKEAMEPFFQIDYGNPSAPYSFARAPRKAIARAKEIIAEAICAHPDEIFFTSGGTEADNWAIKGTAFQYGPGKQIITSAIEHHAVLNSCTSLGRMGYEIKKLTVDTEGRIDPDTLKDACTSDTVLVSVMLANNEIGTIEPIKFLANVAHRADVLFHTDAVQAVGHIPIDVSDLQVDMLSASAHKFNGPKGVGFLYIRKGTNLLPFIDGGGQERGMRSGTENVAGIVGMAAALQEHTDHLQREYDYLTELMERLVVQLRQYGLDFIINGSNQRIPGSLSLSFKNADGEMLLHRLDLMGTAIATGSACNSEDTEISHVIREIHVPKEYAYGTVRITFGMENTEEQVDTIAQQLFNILERY